MVKFLLNKNYIETLNKLYIFQNKYNYGSCCNILSVCNKYEEYTMTKNKRYLHEISRLIGSKQFTDSFMDIKKKNIMDVSSIEHINGIFDECVKNNFKVMNHITESLNIIQNISDINTDTEKVDDKDVYKLLDKLNNSIDLIYYTSNCEHHLRTNEFELLDTLQKKFDRTLLQKYKLDPVVNYMFHIMQTIYVDHCCDHGTKQNVRDIMHEYDRTSQDILDSDIHINIHNLSDDMYNTVLETCRTEYDALFSHKENLHSFLQAVRDIVSNDKLNHMNHEELSYSLYVLSKYLCKNISVIRKTMLLDDKDLNILAHSLSKEMYRCKQTTQKINTLLHC